MVCSYASFFLACVDNDDDNDDDDELFVPCEPEVNTDTANDNLCECKLVDVDVWEIVFTVPFVFVGIHFFKLQISNNTHS